MPRRRLSVDDLSDESEYAESDENDGVESDTDLTDVETYGVNEQGENVDKAWHFADKNPPPQHYLQQLETFDETEYDREDYAPGSTRLLDRMEDKWNECWTYLKRDDLRAYSTVSVCTLHTFFDWLLGRSEGRGGGSAEGQSMLALLGRTGRYTGWYMREQRVLSWMRK